MTTTALISDYWHPVRHPAHLQTRGIRVGTLAVTTRGMKEEEMLDIADLLNEALNNRDDAGAVDAVHNKVAK